MTGKQDESAALAFVIDEVGLQPAAEVCPLYVAMAACRGGYLGCLQLLHLHCCIDALIADCLHCIAALIALQLGSLPLLQQLRERGCSWGASVWDGAPRSLVASTRCCRGCTTRAAKGQ
jgi:hypothetical protein